MQTATTFKLYKASMLRPFTQAPVRCNNIPLISSRNLNKDSVAIPIQIVHSLLQVYIQIISLCPSPLAARTIHIPATPLPHIRLLLRLSQHIHSMQALRSNTLPLHTSGRNLSPPSYKIFGIFRKLRCPCHRSLQLFPPRRINNNSQHHGPLINRRWSGQTAEATTQCPSMNSPLQI